jgi:hypothetical protein
VIAALASLLIVPGIAAAAGGTGPWDAYAIDGAWRQIDRGQAQWYAFRYDGEDEQIVVKLNAKPADGAKFMVFTPDEARVWQQVGDEEPCGCSAEDEFVGADQSWSGHFNIPGTYYIAVKHSGHHDAPTYYALNVSGKGVAAAGKTAPAAPSAPASAGAAAATAAVTTEDMSPFEDWVTMEGDTSHWETFHYDKPDSKVELILDVEPNTAATFSVWTPEQVRLYSLGLDVDPVGWGTVNEKAPGDVSWSGSFVSPGKYYVRVDHLGQDVGYCKLTLKGENVWF